ncbi:TPA-induced transmembrane protein homolog isoform 1 [Mus musculus]|uniref:TPA-induced transmembrane protein homolog isoform 1 n=1 Tax=Mus musculus TaxID=10090 RepID=UPI0003D71776|nr:TPA-induced transmembrane protein homolog isoform 1 [Mus musculus]|eukprot:XP_006522036.1 PREDICTED: TPA-induced transmembrane protein homolog isoform X1 [Mus musculus]
MEEGSRSQSPREELELSMLDGPQEELTPLNNDLRIQPNSAEDPSPAQVGKESPWSPCNKSVVGKCKLWMVIVTIFLCFIIVIVISLCLVGVTYIDEDENEILELSSNKTFFITLKIPEECANEEELHHLLTERNFSLGPRKQPVWLGWLTSVSPGSCCPCLPSTCSTKELTDTYRQSPSLSRFFTSADILDFSVENATVTYHLQFGVPSEDDDFMKYMMSEELVLGIMRQSFHDKNISTCESLGLDPESLLLYE